MQNDRPDPLARRLARALRDGGIGVAIAGLLLVSGCEYNDYDHRGGHQAHWQDRDQGWHGDREQHHDGDEHRDRHDDRD